MAKELFIVEGESAASTLQQALDKPTQSVLAVQGKLLNTAKASSEKVLANEACQKIFRSLECGIGDDCEPALMKFSRVFILTDPDVDGAHARILLITLFDRYLRALVDSGLVYVIIPPIFRISIGNQQEICLYAWNEQERADHLDKMAANSHSMITRFKGVAQFSPEECSRLFLHPAKRKQLQLNGGTALESGEAV